MSEQDAVFADYSRYYDLLYGDKDYDAETAYVHALLARHGLSRASVLEFGSGTGRPGAARALRLTASITVRTTSRSSGSPNSNGFVSSGRGRAAPRASRSSRRCSSGT